MLVIQSYTEKVRYTEHDKEVLTFVSQHVATAIERKRASEAIKKYSRELEELNRSKDRFFSIISHDLRSPFHPLLGLAEMISTEAEDLTKDELKDYTNEIYELIKNQYSLLEDLLEWSRLQSNTLAFNTARLNLYENVNEVLQILSENAQAKKIIFVNTVEPGISINADKNFFRSILQNLISNAIKFSFDEGKILISAARVDSKVEISIKDYGIGLDKKEVEKLFAIDSGHSSPGTRNEKGSGLGLILCKEMVEKHGGKIWVYSEKGKGCKFTFTMPLSK